jgi:hypothetical protein
MNIESFNIPAFITIILALSSLIVIPQAAMAGSKNSVAIPAKSSDSPEGAACDLPPIQELEGKGAELSDSGLSLLDKRVPEKFKTATFAMG